MGRGAREPASSSRPWSLTRLRARQEEPWTEGGIRWVLGPHPGGYQGQGRSRGVLKDE